MNKKALVILGAIFLLIVGTLGFLIYSRYSKKSDEPPQEVVLPGNPEDNTTPIDPVTPVDEIPNSTTTQQQVEKFTKLTQAEKVLSPILFFYGNGVTYFDDQGKLNKADFETLANGGLGFTRNRNIDIQRKNNLEKILWPKNGDDFIAVLQPDSGSSKYSYFNFSTGNFTDLPAQVKQLEWLPSGDKVIYIWTDKDSSGNTKSTLNIANPDTSGYTEIAELWETDNMLSLSPDGLNLVLFRAGSSSAINKLLMVSTDGKVWKDLSKEGYNYGVLWSPDSQKILFSKRERNGRNFQLWYYDLYDGQVKNLGVYGAPQKAVWGSDSRTIYYASPTSSSEVIDPENLDASGRLFTTDSFYKLDTSSMEKKEFVPENISLDGRDLFLNVSEDKLFFKNAQDGGLYYLDLTK